MRKKTIKQYLEILLATLLPCRGEWQVLASYLPAGACLLVTKGEYEDARTR